MRERERERESGNSQRRGRAREEDGCTLCGSGAESWGGDFLAGPK